MLQANPDSIFSVSRDPEQLRLANAFAGAKSVAEYTQTGQAYQQYATEHAGTYIMLMEANEVWARSDKVSAQWKLGRDTNARRLGYAAAPR